eukprot:Pgem_evm1s16309
MNFSISSSIVTLSYLLTINIVINNNSVLGTPITHSNFNNNNTNNNNTYLNIDGIIEFAQHKYSRSAGIKTPKNEFPTADNYKSSKSHSWTLTVPVKKWTSGFFGGSLWYLYALTNDESFRESARKWTEPLKENKDNKNTHDIGFMIYDSFGKGIELGGMDEEYYNIVEQAAYTLSLRYNEKVGLLQSWQPGKRCIDDSDYQADYPVIIDNMMNLELLFKVAERNNDETLKNIAISHALKTADIHVRSDGSVYHVVDFNNKNGEVLKKCTYQGLHDESSWTRGSGWCMHGFSTMYKYTKNVKFLETAERCADFFLEKLNETSDDNVPLWDFDFKNKNGNSLGDKDSSAGAIAASALVELSKYVMSRDKGIKYFDKAQDILLSLSGDDYLVKNNNTLGLLRHAMGFYRKKREVDTSI